MKRPLLIVALLYACGVILGNFLPLPLPWLLGISLIVASVALLWNKARPGLLWPLIFLAGLTNLTFHTSILSPHDLRNAISNRTEYVTLRGVLSETPYQRVYQHDQEPSWRTIAEIKADSLHFKTSGHSQTVFGSVAVSTPGILPPDYFAGQTVEVTGILHPPKGPVAEGLFDYRAYLSQHGIYYQLQVASTNDWQLLSHAAVPPLADRFVTWAQATLARGLPEVDEPLRLLWAMTLGWKTALTSEVSDPFMRSGTMHIFAISGLHIALIAGILVSLLRVCKMPRGWCGLLVIPLIWLYTGVTGWQASAIRSTVMMTIIIAGWSLKRPSDLLNSLAAAACIILVWDPQQLFQASFQLSFFVVLSLALFVPVLEKVREYYLGTDPFLPKKLELELRPRWRRGFDPALRHTSASLVTSLAAWLGSIPLVAYYFHLFTPVSLLANLIVVPLSSFALMSNLASLICGNWLPSAGELFNHSAWFFMLWMERVSAWAAHLPAGCFNIAPPTTITFALYYALLISLMAGWLARPRARIWTAAGLAALCLAWLVQWQTERSAIRLTILPLNGGDAIYLDAPGSDHDWLIDCGNPSAANFVTKPFLRTQGVNRLPRLLLTHGDLRQIGGAEMIRNDFRVPAIYFSPVHFRSSAYRELQEKCQQQPGLARTLTRGDQPLPWTVLHPESNDHFPQADDNAIVLRGEFFGTRVLLLSDLGKPGQNALITRHPDLRADIVVAGLPQQTEPLADALIDAIQPRLIIITDAEYPASERASKKLRARLARHNIPVLYTRETGAVTLTFRKSGWEKQIMLPVPETKPVGAETERDFSEDESR